MKDKKSFKEFCSEIQKLEEQENGKLKGGFSSVSLKVVSIEMEEDHNKNCHNCHCEVHPK